jgi:hypothetical protein
MSAISEWTPDGLLRHVVYLGEREGKAARDVIRLTDLIVAGES